MLRTPLHTPLTLALAACLSLVLVSGAGAAAALATESRGLLGHRGVPGGSLPQVNTVTRPAPPVTASAFGVELAGTPPAAGDGLIPNPATPTGSAIAPPSSCTVTFASAGGATSATVNSWIA